MQCTSPSSWLAGVWFVGEDFPLDPIDLMLTIMEGSERSSFDLIEQFLPGVINSPALCVCGVWHMSVSFLLKLFGNIDEIDELIEDVKFVINFAGNHTMPPRNILRELHRLSMMVWCVTRFGTIFICTYRLIELQTGPWKLLLHEKGKTFLGKGYCGANEKAQTPVSVLQNSLFSIFQQSQILNKSEQPILIGHYCS